MNKKIAIIGSGGHADVIIDNLSQKQRNSLIGYIDTANNGIWRNLPYLGADYDFLEKNNPKEVNLLLGVSYLGQKVSLELRKKIISIYTSKGFVFESIISNRAILSKSAHIKSGTYVGPGVCINSNVVIESHCIINTGAIIEHDCYIGKNVQISPGVILCGSVNVGEHTFIGAGSICRDGIYICDNVVIGFGSIVNKDLSLSGTYLGHPVKLIKNE
jgi:sugar O-acyltransferase (sialic acid O-acetyltransferase NeuD family)